MHIPKDRIANVIRAVEHYADYLRATNRDDHVYRELAERLKLPPARKASRTVLRVRRQL